MLCWSLSTKPGLAVARIEAFVARTTSRGAAAGPAASSRAAATGSSATSQRQPVAHRGFGVEAHAEQQRRAGGLRADGALQHPRRTAAGMDAQLLEAGIEERRGAGDAHVGCQREVQPGADGGAVDGGDRRQRAVGDREKPVVDHAQPVLGGLAESRQVRRPRRTPCLRR